MSNSDNPAGDPPPAGEAQTGTGGNPPPLGSEWDNESVLTIVEVTDPDVDPNDEAGNQNVESLADDTSPGSGGWRTPPGQTRPTIYVNHPQTCTIFCPDGSPFSFTVPVARYRSFSQADADRAAYSFACRQAQLNAICLGSIASTTCVDQVYNQTIIANTANIPVSFSVISGSIPDWATATVGPSSIRIRGTPDTGDIGTYAFTIQAVDVFGFTMTKGYSIEVTECVPLCSITESTLTAFDQGQSYSAQLHATGGTAPYSWALVEGQLPDGLSLSTSGLISGISDLTNGNLDQTFTVQATDASNPASQCEKAITLPVLDYHVFPPGKHWRIQGYVDGDLNATCSGAIISGTTWSGDWIIQKASAWFSQNFPGEIGKIFGIPGGPFTGYGVKPYLAVGNTFGTPIPTNEWVILVLTNTGGAIWSGKKVGSNSGVKLDSPAGVYNFSDVGLGSCAVLPATLTIEEY